MKLKKYQKQVLKDLSNYLKILNETSNIKTAYTKHWNSKDVRVGYGGMPEYKDSIIGTPHVCFKVPTGERVIIVTGCINALVSRVSGTLIKNNSCIA